MKDENKIKPAPMPATYDGMGKATLCSNGLPTPPVTTPSKTMRGGGAATKGTKFGKDG